MQEGSFFVRLFSAALFSRFGVGTKMTCKNNRVIEIMEKKNLLLLSSVKLETEKILLFNLEISVVKYLKAGVFDHISCCCFCVCVCIITGCFVQQSRER